MIGRIELAKLFFTGVLGCFIGATLGYLIIRAWIWWALEARA